MYGDPLRRDDDVTDGRGAKLMITAGAQPMSSRSSHGTDDRPVALASRSDSVGRPGWDARDRPEDYYGTSDAVSEKSFYDLDERWRALGCLPWRTRGCLTRPVRLQLRAPPLPAGVVLLAARRQRQQERVEEARAAPGNGVCGAQGDLPRGARARATPFKAASRC